jgi:two-component system CheB/CheR fusion protein
MTAAEPDEAFEELLEYLKEQRGFDFTGYKRPSLMRRVRRRMDMLDIVDFSPYCEYLELHPDEFTTLFNTILINVTSFFRDVDAWRYLQQETLPELLRRCEGRPIRVWSAGCASGQEAYTLAMLLAEALTPQVFSDLVKVYATDVDEEALGSARQALFTDSEVASVPRALLEKYFDRNGGRFAVRKELRRSVIFGRNDLVRDAPISHVDILTCRNTLMYFNAETQAHILNRLHFALRPEGVLFLGKAEMLLSHSLLFSPIDLRRRFFRRAPGSFRERPPVDFGAPGEGMNGHPLVQRVLDEALLSGAVPQIVLDDESRLVFCNNRASQLFGLNSRDLGRPLTDLDVSYRPVEISGHIAQASRERRTVWIRDVVWSRPSGESSTFDIQVVPLADDAGAVLGTTVIYTDVSSYKQLQGELEYANRQLETAYEEVQSTNEELETTNEELQSTVEELETTNEELQSTNEELETMNEELQSMNDELHMSNDGLRDRQEQVDRLNDLMGAVLASLQSGVMVVDAELRVLAWNRLAEELWGVRADESLGQRLMALDIGLPVDQLQPAIMRQLGDETRDRDVMRLSAVNRRGRDITVEVSVMKLATSNSYLEGVIVVMDIVSEPAA